MDAQTFQTPKTCPCCHRSIILEQENILGESVFGTIAEMAFLCPHRECRKFFIGYFRRKTDKRKRIDNYFIEKLLPVAPLISIPISIEKISPSFKIIFSESIIAKELGLSQICGVGFRKALEFLVKDYAKTQTLISEHANIERMGLSKVVLQYFPGAQIKTIAERAVWLGNDETHYIRKWKNKDVEDLLLMIDLTIQWINIDHSSRRLSQEMPQA